MEDEIIKQEIDSLVTRSKKALNELKKMNQDQIDNIVKQMTLDILENHMLLAKEAVSETKRGIVEDKSIKNLFAAEYVSNSFKDVKTVGIVNENEIDGYYEVLEPVGIIAGVTPVTNPTSTTIFKSLISIKARNPIIFAFHPSAQGCSSLTAKILNEAIIKANGPKDCILWVENPSINATKFLMNHEDISLILATGGSSMVKSAYGSFKPALGVGAGNVCCFIEKSANIKRAVNDLILSKTFDNGMICASEQSVIVETDIEQAFIDTMRYNGCYFLNDEEIDKLTAVLFNKEKNNSLNPDIVGQSAKRIATLAGINVEENVKILIAKQTNVGNDYPLSKEKLSPVLAFYTVKNKDEALRLADDLINFGGLGHTAVIHSEDNNIIEEYSKILKVGRLIVNSPSSQGAIGDIYNILTPSLTLGCGTFGKNSTTSNVSVLNLVNVKRVAKRRVNMQWFKVPKKIFFEEGSISYLKEMEGVEKVFVVTDKTMVSLGYVDKIKHHLNQRLNKVSIEVFSDILPDPSFTEVLKGVEKMNTFNPDTIIALGGGSPIDAAKVMWLLYEQGNVDIESIKLKFMDIRKRTYKIKELGKKAKLVAIPTTSGTGSEVTSFSVITDKEKNIKYPLAYYELTPDVAIIDRQLVLSMPYNVCVDTGMDVLTHAIESYVSVMASDFTDALSEKAIELVFKYLKRSCENSKDLEAREKMHNASCIAGMSFTNAFLGINHSLAHKIGLEFNISHGRANAILLPYVIKYNSKLPNKFSIFPKYETFIADEKYMYISRKLGYTGSNKEDATEYLVDKVITLMKDLNMPTTFLEYGINEKEYLDKIDILANNAFEDQCTLANPKMPLIPELKEILIKAYYGEII